MNCMTGFASLVGVLYAHMRYHTSKRCRPSPYTLGKIKGSVILRLDV